MEEITGRYKMVVMSLKGCKFKVTEPPGGAELECSCCDIPEIEVGPREGFSLHT